MKFRYLFILLFTILLPIRLFASSFLYFTEPPKNIEVGERFTVYFRLRASEEPINAISAVVSYPSNLVKAVSVSKEGSIINLWTGEPRIYNDRISFEGVVLNPGFSGSNGLLLKAIFEARSTGVANMNFIEGATLASDGLGSNILATLSKTSLRIVPATLKPDGLVPIYDNDNNERLAKLPVITNYSENVNAKEKIILEGKGEPNTLTKIVFKDVALRSLGEILINRIQNNKIKLDEVLVKNDKEGNFKYISGDNLVAGVYNATPFLVDEASNVEKPGLGIQLFVNDSKIVKNLIVFINVLGLFIPIVVLCVIIYFIPWYSWLRMKILKKKMNLEEEKIELSGIHLAKEENLFNKDNNKNNA
jgi:hypothetical protein